MELMLLICAFAYFVGSAYAEEFEITPQRITYLQDYGYLETPNPDAGSLQTQRSLKNSIKEFQRFARLPVTGVIDEATRLKFEQPRCGIKDTKKNERAKRYVHQGSKWHKKDLTYQIENWTTDLSKKEVLRTVRSALEKWERASQLTFRYKSSGYADIKIRFTRRKHNDQYAFDGPGGTLAHAFYPGLHPLSGDTHFDDDELFTLNTKKGKNFYWVSLHEFGHALGMDHTNEAGTIMYPWYEGYKGYDVDLSDDDKLGIQALYGKPKVTSEKPKIKSEKKLDPTPNKGQCLSRIQSIFVDAYGDVVVINGDKVNIYDKNLRKKKSPIPLARQYPGMSGVDAVYTLPSRRNTFVHGKRTWEYYRQVRRSGPYKSQQVFGEEIYDIDAAFYWSRTKKVYIFKGDSYWRYDPYRKYLDKSYPKKISEGWAGVPDNIDSVFVWNKKIYFFKGDQYYRFNQQRIEVHRGYPKPISEFFDCQQKPSDSKEAPREVVTANLRSSGDEQVLPVTLLTILSTLVSFIRR